MKNTKFEWSKLRGVDEVALVDEHSNQVVTSCYRTDPGRYQMVNT